MADLEANDKKKSHRERHSGRKADKKKTKKDQNIEEVTDKQRNPKAFTFNSAIRAERRFRRKQDIDTKKQHVPLVDRTPLEPPPILIAIVGPPKVGKTTLMNNLIKLFTKSPVTDIKGPVTIVTGKKRRVTLVECNNDINSMIDLAKVCDLALLLSDASFGFEMEVFEFLNICQVHGMPRIMGVLTHLDLIKNSKTLKNTKKTLKHRFWTEVYPGAKLFYLSGILHGEYLRNEIKNLGRFISVMKFRPLLWRQNHSYILGDRYEDLTNQELIRQNPKCDRHISLYGYIRGVPLKKENSVHIAGFGDLKIHDISYLPDPCPLPEELKKRALVEKERLIYAPFSGVGGIVYDKDAVYVELKNTQSQTKKVEKDETSNILANLLETKESADVKMEKSELQIFSGGQKLTGKDFELAKNERAFEQQIELIEAKSGKSNKNLDEDNDLSDELNKLRKQYQVQEVEDSGRTRRRVIFNDQSDDETAEFKVKSAPKPKGNTEINMRIKEVLNGLGQKMEQDEEISSEEEEDDNDDDDVDDDDVDDEGDDNEDKSDLEMSSDDGDEDLAVTWKNNLMKKAKDAFLERVSSSQNLMKLVYGVFDAKYQKDLADSQQKEEQSEEEGDIGGIFKKVSKAQEKLKSDKDNMNLMESSLMFPWDTATKDWTQEENKVLIANCFVTGKWKDSEDAAELLKLDETENLSDMDSELEGDFEDLETGEKHVAQKRKREEPEKDEKADREALAEKKRKLKEKFDAEYDNTDKSTFYEELKMTAEKQAQLNKTVFENMPDDVRVQVEGFRPGMYVRMEFENVPSEFITNFDPTYPIVIGSLNIGEENIGYVNVRVKKHRWYGKILKTNDPLIISLGWRRFQTIPIFSKLEDDLKYRYLKYTPEHLACNAQFWGPITPQGTGFLALQSVDSNPEILKKQGFRIAATGSVQELDKSTRIMKKLKLVGYPLKIYKKTAFIKGMFNSALEVAKFEGASIQTVSGVRGEIKKAISKPEGCFRAAFEDKILLSDIVFCPTWCKVNVQEFYTPITTLLLPPDQKNQWTGLRTTGQIKREKDIKNPANKDSLYTPIIREEKPFKPLIIPAKLQKALPYRDKPNHGVKSSEKKKLTQRVAVIREPHEEKIAKMLKMIKTSYQHKQAKLKEETKQRLEKHRRDIAAQELSKERKIKQKKKEVFRKKSKAQASQDKKADRD
ncbi:ribosome biogenesis protein BMS1 homolog [Anthonomus grandis grandis]|uniref:ribosome biogenesis protein BMS1 homolog n=1 Tax=Anthonomus grandis grandis TaxID=2921223 RepID=UPI002165FF72|nr:ribosome biogenesis protein BMS1 homolog [Anthonomus grandis grandis]